MRQGKKLNIFVFEGISLEIKKTLGSIALSEAKYKLNFNLEDF